MAANAKDMKATSFDLWLKALAERSGDALALATNDGGESLSFAEVERRSAVTSAGLKALGLRRGDAVAIWLPNSPLWMVLHFAAARAGILTIPINTWCRDSEVSHLLRLGRCKGIFIDPAFHNIDFAGILARVVAEFEAAGDNPLRWVCSTGDAQCDIPSVPNVSLRALQQLGTDAPKLRREPAEPSPAGKCVIAFTTSGTTAAPKLALHREGALIAHAEAIARRARMSSSDVALAALPPCGAYGYCLILAAMAAGCCAVQCREFSVDLAVDVIPAQSVSVLALTEPLFRKMFDHPSASRDAFRSLRAVFSAGATLEPVVQRAEDEFGFRLTNVYGSSEILALAAFWGAAENVAERAQAGGILTSTGMRVRAADDAGNVLPPGGVGELQFTGPIVTAGYLGNGDATRAAFTDDGWFRSGDLGRVLDEDGSSFHYLARMGDAMRLKGFLVHPGEIEDMLQQHPEVSAAQVVGIPEGTGEEVPVAFVILGPGARATPDMLREFCRARMASYKVPAAIEIVDAFPTTRSPNGDKVVKARLREMAKELIAHG